MENIESIITKIVLGAIKQILFDENMTGDNKIDAIKWIWEKYLTAWLLE